MGDYTVYYYFPNNGSFGSIDSTGTAPQPVPEGAVEITYAEYQELLAAYEESERQREEEQRAAEEARQLAEYLEMRQAGIPHATAARLSGYTGPERTE